MIVPLHDGNQAEIRDQLLAGDKRAAKDALKIKIGDDGERVMSAAMEDLIIYALLRRMIISWTLPQPIPRDIQTGDEQWMGVLDNLTIEDQEALAEAVRPYYDRCLNGPKPQAISGAVLPTGTSPGQELPAR